ncbi:unnamed protein product [Darwinula stevensoni]|uniref:CARD domain-containing protein n=1 Tax=Darwinula stevensoni TaxID=69355 RepID=A0A7R9FPL2_9CRUS|nr:unnamed protein product [Darwinula stevensoni]CAG0898080.1 unnamed protein product [Darwinula stevensoni]
MSEEPRSWDRIRANRLNIIDKHVDCDELVRQLSCRGVFTVREEKQILKIINPTERNDEFFFILYSKNPQTAVNVFFEALIAMERQDVVDFLQDFCSVPQSSTLERNRRAVSRLDTLDPLSARKVTSQCWQVGHVPGGPQPIVVDRPSAFFPKCTEGQQQQDVTDLETRTTKFLDILCKKPKKYQEWYLDLLVVLQDLGYSTIAEDLESKTDLKVRIRKVWLKFTSIRKPKDIMTRMMTHGILNCDEVRTIDDDYIFNEQRMSSLGHVLEKKNGRNLARISRCLLEAGYRSIAEDLLHSSKAELDEYSSSSDFKVYGEKILHALEEGKDSLLEVKGVLDSLESGEGMNQLKDMVECLKKSEEERMDQLKSMADSFEKSGGEIMERLQCVTDGLKKSEGEGVKRLTSMIDSLKKSEEERMEKMKRVIDISENSEERKMGQRIFILEEMRNVGKEKDQEIKALQERLLNMSKTLTEEEGLRAKSEDISKRLEERLQKREAELKDAKTQVEEMQIQSENQSKLRSVIQA